MSLSVKASDDGYEELNELAQTLATLKNAHMYPYLGVLSSLDTLEIASAIADIEELMAEYMGRLRAGLV